MGWSCYISQDSENKSDLTLDLRMILRNDHKRYDSSKLLSTLLPSMIDISESAYTDLSILLDLVVLSEWIFSFITCMK
jgi:hypothetical protein